MEGEWQSSQGGGEEEVNIVSPEPDAGDSHCGHVREAFHRGEQGWRCEQSSSLSSVAIMSIFACAIKNKDRSCEIWSFHLGDYKKKYQLNTPVII